MSDRQLRSSSTNPRTGNKRQLSFDGLPPSGSSRPKKRRKVEYRCVRCGQNKPSRSFPETTPSPRCIHDIHTCTECLQAWVDTQIRDDLLVVDVRANGSYGLRCPECPELIQAADVQAIATPEMCRNPGCEHGRIPWPYMRYFSQCPRCNFRSFLSCSPGHLGETCAAYNARIQNPVEREDESLELIGRLTRPCPYCGFRVERNGGCANMICKYYFRYLTDRY